MYRYSSGTITLPLESLVQTLSSNKCHFILQRDTCESFVLDRYQDVQEYHIKLVNNLT